MRKFVILFIMLIMSISANAQFAKTHSDERDIAEWKSAMKQITAGKSAMWTGIAVGGIATSTGLVVLGNCQSHINNGEYIYREVLDGSGNAVSTTTYENVKSITRTAIIVTDVVCVGVAVAGVVMQRQGRKKCDRLYFGSGGIVYTF